MTWFVIGLFIGFIVGSWFYSKYLDKPETVQKINKQKVRKGGIFRNIFNSKKERHV